MAGAHRQNTAYLGFVTVIGGKRSTGEAAQRLRQEIITAFEASDQQPNCDGSKTITLYDVPFEVIVREQADGRVAIKVSNDTQGDMIFALHKLGNVLREERRAAAKAPAVTIDTQSVDLSGKAKESGRQVG